MFLLPWSYSEVSIQWQLLFPWLRNLFSKTQGHDCTDGQCSLRRRYGNAAFFKTQFKTRTSGPSLMRRWDPAFQVLWVNFRGWLRNDPFVIQEAPEIFPSHVLIWQMAQWKSIVFHRHCSCIVVVKTGPLAWLSWVGLTIAGESLNSFYTWAFTVFQAQQWTKQTEMNILFGFCPYHMRHGI